MEPRGGANYFTNIRAPILEKIKPLSSGDNNNLSNRNPDISSNNRDSSEAKLG